MKNGNFFYTVKFKILVCVAVFLAGMMAYAGVNGRLTAAPQELLGVLLTPFQRISATLSDGAQGLLDKYARIDSIIAENESLQAENQQLRQQLVDYDAAKAENQAFRDLLAMEERHPEYTYASGFIIGRDPLEQFGSFTVDQGTVNGVKRGDVVVSDQGYLVGLVAEVNLTSSRVVTLLSPSVNAAAVISSTRDNGIVTGDTTYASQGMCTLTNLPRETLAAEGDQVVTTGLGGVFPEGILVGTIHELVPESSGKSIVAVLQPGAEVTTLTHVFIITASSEDALAQAQVVTDAMGEAAAQVGSVG